MQTAASESLHFFKAGLQHAATLYDAAERAAGLICELFHADRVCVAFLEANGELISVVHGGGSPFQYRSQLTLEQGRIKRDGRPLAVPLFISDQTHAELREAYLALIGTPGTRALGIVPLYVKGALSGWIECHFFEKRSRWIESDCLLLRQCADITSFTMQDVRSQTESAMSTMQEKTAAPVQKERIRIDLAPWCMFDLNKDGLIQKTSCGEQKFSVFEILDWKGHSFSSVIRSFVGKEEQRILHEDLDNILKGLLPRTERIISFTRDKKEVPVLVHIESGLPDAEYITVVLSDISEPLTVQEKLQEARLQSMRLINYGQMLVIRTDSHFRITDVVGDSMRLLGVGREELLWKRDFWTTIVREEDLRVLRKTVREMDGHYTGFADEIQITHPKNNRVRWLLLNTAPLFHKDGAFIGWEAIVVDVTERRQAEHELLAQQKRLEALYDVSRALEGNMDPAFVALRGLRALIAATSCTGGLAAFYDRAHDHLDIVAAQGLTPSYMNEITRVMDGSNLLRLVIENRSGMLVDNIQEDPRAARALARKEGLRSAILMPLMYEEADGTQRVLGSFVLFSRRAGKFSSSDFELVAAAARQLGLVLRQAEFYAAEKRYTSSVKALYRLSHELSGLFTPREVAAHALPILEEELGCNRIWMGVINEAGTHIVGQGAQGPGVSAGIAELQIELSTPHDFLDEALETGKPVVVPVKSEMECGGLTRLLQRLKPNDLVVVPLVSLGQSVGVLIVEPEIEMQRFLKQRLPLLSSMASEMATVVVARRFEARMAGAEKMRMAGLFASGVAHNFNNMLQAIMGQAALVEMQIPNNPVLHESTAVITEVALKGAELIKQLLAMTRRDTGKVECFDMRELFTSAAALYQSVLGARHELLIEAGDSEIPVKADRGQIQQIFSHLIMNARDALQEDRPGRVKISMRKMRVTTGEVHPELSPGIYVCIEIEDNGVGMQPESVLRCFEPFFTTKNVDRDTGLALDGSGLGLSVAYSIAREYNGLIVIQSKAGAGTTVCTYLPLYSESPAATPTSPTSMPDREARTVALLNLSGSESADAIEVFGAAGLGCIEFPSSLDVITAAHRRKDLCLIAGSLDNTDCDVEAFVQEIRRRIPDIAFVFVSENAASWERKLVGYSNLSVIQAPARTVALRKVLQRLVRVSLRDMLEIETTDDSGKAIPLHENRNIAVPGEKEPEEC